MRAGTGRHTLSLFCLLAGILSLVLGVWMLCQDLLVSARYQDLAETRDSSEGDQANELDSNAPEGASSDTTLADGSIAAWVKVEGTPIDLPVASGDRGFSWYLHHDLWGNASEVGCPFLDPRCPGAGSPHVLVYGHHLAFTNLMFSGLHDCYKQKRFDTLGDCQWTYGNTETRLRPLCSLSVDQDWSDILRFSFGSIDDLRSWARAMVDQSSAKSPDAEELASGAMKVITLVTCSSDVAGLRSRTLVLFAC